jgi:uncharacterized protein (DUF3820 family)
MSTQERKPSYTDRLIKHLCESEDLEDLDLKLVIDCIREFSKSVANQIKQEENANPDTLPFGKYKGKKIEDIHKIDSKYLVWLRRQSFLKDNLKEALDEVLTDD